MRAISRYPTASFVLLTFWITGGLALLYSVMQPRVDAAGVSETLKWSGVYMAIWAPSISGMLVTFARGGRLDLLNLLGQLTRRAPLSWWALALAIPIGIELAAIVLSAPLSEYSVARAVPVDPWVIVAFALTTVVGAPLGEEFGWRGYALPNLARQIGATKAAIAIAVAWLIWHLPAFVVPGLQPIFFPSGLSFVQFIGFIVGGSLISALLYFNAEGALGVPVLFHLSMLSATLIVGDTPPEPLVWTASGLYAALGGILALSTRDLRGWRWEKHVARGPQSKTRTEPRARRQPAPQLGGFAIDR